MNVVFTNSNQRILLIIPLTKLYIGQLKAPCPVFCKQKLCLHSVLLTKMCCDANVLNASRFLKYFKSRIVYICLLACSRLLPCLYWHIAKDLCALLLPVDQWYCLKSLVGIYITSISKQINKHNNKQNRDFLIKKRLHCAIRG